MEAGVRDFTTTTVRAWLLVRMHREGTDMKLVYVPYVVTTGVELRLPVVVWLLVKMAGIQQQPVAVEVRLLHAKDVRDVSLVDVRQTQQCVVLRDEVSG